MLSVSTMALAAMIGSACVPNANQACNANQAHVTRPFFDRLNIRSVTAVTQVTQKKHTYPLYIFSREDEQHGVNRKAR